MLLLIDTAGETATVILSSEGVLLGSAQNLVARDHSAWLHPAVAGLLSESGHSFSDLQAIAVTSGPGSYTGLRVGMAAAKGFCFALGVPLITCNSLLVAAASMIPLSSSLKGELLCPMIDARRMEVFTALYNDQLEEIMPPQALILDKTSFEQEMHRNNLLFSGSGADKWQAICISPAGRFIAQPDINQAFISIATDRFKRQVWADTVYSEPEYGKEFHTHVIN